MSNPLIHFELVSPEEKLVSDDVYIAEMPGDMGVFGVAAGHVSLISALQPGVVRLLKESGDRNPRKIFVTGGFADVTAKNCSVLAEEAIDVKDLDKDSLETDLKNFSEDLTLAKETADVTRIKDKIAMTKAKLRAVA